MANGTSWTPEEYTIIKEHYATETLEQLQQRIAKHGTSRTLSAIKRKATALHTKKLTSAPRWTPEEEELLRQKYTTATRQELEKTFGRRYEAIVAKATNLQLSRSNTWSSAELKFLEENAHLPTRELAQQLGRSLRAVMHKRKHLTNTTPGTHKEHRTSRAKSQQLKSTWAMPTPELAYIIGVLCSDGTLRSPGITLSVHAEDHEFAAEFSRCCMHVFGIPPIHTTTQTTWEYQGERHFGTAYMVHVFSVRLLAELGTAAGVACGNWRGPDGEWCDAVEAKFPWVREERFVWYFLGGLYDGDGCASQGKVSIAIGPTRSKSWTMNVLEQQGIAHTTDYQSIIIQKKHKEVFLKKLKHVLFRKNPLRIQDATAKPPHEYIRIIPQYTCNLFLETFHYLKSVPANCVCYGFFQQEMMCGVAAVSDNGRRHGLKTLELRRFAVRPGVKSSPWLSRVVKHVRHRKDVDVLVTFADAHQNHYGTIYQATNAWYVGQTGGQVAYVTPEGRTISGRYADKQLSRLGLTIDDCMTLPVPGKHKYVYPFSDDAKTAFAKVRCAYPKSIE